MLHGLEERVRGDALDLIEHGVGHQEGLDEGEQLLNHLFAELVLLVVDARKGI